MSHEIRTPMNGVIGMVELLLDTPLSDEQRRFAQAARSSSTILMSVVNDILDISKVEAGKVELETVDFCLKNIVDDLSAIISAKAAQKGLHVASEYDERIPEYVLGDPRRLQQVLLNLAGNAIKFTSAGEVRIRVTEQQRNDDTSVVLFEVADTGIGINIDTVDRLFDKFSQADASTTRKFGGTGLGLAISKQLVELMNGTIGVRPEENGGAVFFFELPLKAHVHSPADVSAAPVQNTRKPVDVSNDGAGVRILLVEDNPTNQLLAELMLKKMGHSVEIAGDGLEALDALRASTFDVVLMDCQMPEMDGYEASRKVRSGESGVRDHAVPIIALTAHAMDGDRERCIGAGMNDYIAKPLSQEVIRQTLQRWIR